MAKLKTWFKKHLTKEVFSFMGLIFSIGAFVFNLITNKIIPLQMSLLDSETTSYADPNIFYVPFVAFSTLLLAIAGMCLYFLFRKKR